jgi:hypothetical protein
LGSFAVGAVGAWAIFAESHGANRRAIEARALVTPTNATEFWTAVLALGTVALAYVAYRGLRSIRLAQRDMLNRATRDALECAVRRCEEFGDVIISHNGQILNGLAAASVPVFVRRIDEVRFDPDNAEDLARAREWWAKVPPPVQIATIKLLNRLEAWCMYLNTGLADSTVMHDPCAAPFMTIVVQCYAPILIYRAHEADGNYPNVVKVYTAWKAQMNAARKDAEQKDLLGRLGELMEARQAAARASLPKPIGTAELD